jgi:hypothetical protein
VTDRQDRREFLHAGAVTAIGVLGGGWLTGCGAEMSRDPTPTAPPTPPTGAGARVLLAYFSRAGENYYYGGQTYLEVGNTETLAGMISSRVACDVHRIEAVEHYSDDYDDTVARNVREQGADARPPSRTRCRPLTPTTSCCWAVAPGTSARP